MILQYDKPSYSHISLSLKSTAGLCPTNTFSKKFDSLFPSYFQEKHTHLSPTSHSSSTSHHKITVVYTEWGSLTSAFQFIITGTESSLLSTWAHRPHFSLWTWKCTSERQNSCYKPQHLNICKRLYILLYIYSYSWIMFSIGNRALRK